MNNLRQVWQWFMGLEIRERRVLGAGVIVLVAFVLYVAVISPYLQYRHMLATELQSQHALLTWMRPAARRIESSQDGQHRALPGGSLLSAVNSSAASAGLGSALQQAQTTNNGAVRVHFNSADFDSLTRWLVTLQRTYGITVSDATVTRASGAGLVDASLEVQSAVQ